ncbi:A kinase anchor protein 200 [Aphomia sociella]
MGAKQSKRSVDISGKEAEGAGEVAVAGAGGEGRVEQLADADALKPQLNGDAHIHETDKEKQLDIATPENEKDATTEKESKEQDNEKEKDTTPVTNGDSGDQKAENGVESSPAPEDGKKPKKEKVKKKWSLRSISFSRKDKPKQEKKQKEEEPKTNGEPEKVPEEAAETTTESAINEVAEEAKPEADNKEEKTPETPVTEPITNGSTTPESPKVETPIPEEPVVVSPETNRPEPKVEPEVEQLPINGLSLEEPKVDATEVTKTEESIPDQPAETTESVPAPEIPVKKEVCVEQMPLIEPTPPPLPANPPPSSVASFAATTMAPELTDASLPNTTESAISSLPALLDTKADLPKEDISVTTIPIIDTENITEPFKSENNVEGPENTQKETIEALKNTIETKEVVEVNEPIPEISKVNVALEITKVDESIPETIEINSPLPKCPETDLPPPPETPESTDISAKMETLGVVMPPPLDSEIAKIPKNSENDNEDLPPPPPMDNIEVPMKVAHEIEETLVNNVTLANNTNGIDDESLNGNKDPEADITNNETKDSLCNIIECNGNIDETKVIKKLDIVTDTTPLDNANIESEKVTTTTDDSLPPSLSEANECVPPEEAGVTSNDASESFPLPPSELCRSESEISAAATPELNDDAPADIPQELLPVSDKIADLIPEVPVVPELKTETETTTDVAVAN